MLTLQDLKFDHKLFGLGYFPQQMFIDQNSIATMYYALQSKNNTYIPSEIYPEITRWLKFLGNSTHLGNTIEKHIDWWWSGDVIKRIKSFSSCNVLLEGAIREITPHKKRLFTHNHPPRHGKDKHLVCTFVTPIYVETDIKEYFRYSDLEKIGYVSPSEEQITQTAHSFVDMCKKFAHTYSHNFDTLRLTEWRHYRFPQFGETLRMDFQAERFVHSVENYTHNVFLCLQFNDVEYINKADERDISFETIRNPNLF